MPTTLSDIGRPTNECLVDKEHAGGTSASSENWEPEGMIHHSHSPNPSLVRSNNCDTKGRAVLLLCQP
eukprot:m.46105 g.46105  ORF g.46105 m.46105 type:complete len:68 (-) comp8717_c0_seq1:11-214(-)